MQATLVELGQVCDELSSGLPRSTSEGLYLGNQRVIGQLRGNRDLHGD
jgi:hypothetical protein